MGMTDTDIGPGQGLEAMPALPMQRDAARALVGLRLAIADMDAQRADLREQGDTNSLLVGLASLKMLVRDLRTLAEQVEQDASDLMGEQGRREVGIDNVGLFERKRSTTRRNWQTRELAAAAVSRAMDADGLGHPSDVVDLMFDVFSISSAKVTALRTRGFEPDEWCEVDEAHYGIKITAETK